MGFLFVNLGHAYAHFFLLIYPAAVVVLEAQGRGNYGDLLLPSTVGFVCFAAGTLPAGWLGDRWSRPGMLAVQFLLLGLGALLVAAGNGTGLLLPGLALIGLGAAIYHPVGLPLAAEAGQGSGLGVGRALGVNGVWGNMGVAAAPLVSGWLAARFGWQQAFLVPGLLSLLTGLVFLPTCRNWQKPAVPGGAAAKPAQAASPESREQRWRMMLFVLVAALFGGLIFSSMTIALPRMLAETPADGLLLGATGLASLVFAVAAFTQIPSGRAVDRLGPRRLVLLLAGLQVVVLGLLAPVGEWSAVVLLSIAMLLIFGEIPVHDALAVRAADPAWRARFFAAKYLLSLGVSAAVVPIIAWLHGPEAGFRHLFVLLAVAAVAIVVAAIVLLPREAPRSARVGAELPMAQRKRPRSI